MFDDNDRVLYPKPCGSSDDANTSSTDDSTDEISQTTTDSSSTATDIEDGDDENNDMKEYPQCFNKQDDQPKSTVALMKMTECYTQNRSENSDNESTITESESISITTSSDTSDSTETHDINRYPRCFFKYSNQPNRSRCCFNSQYQVLYPWPCGGSSEDINASPMIQLMRFHEQPLIHPALPQALMMVTMKTMI